MNAGSGKSLSPELNKAFFDEGQENFRRGASVFNSPGSAVEGQAQLQAHPSWPEWAALSPSVKAACRSDFRVFLAVREAGQLPSLVAQIGKDIERAAASEDRERDRQDLEQHLAAARDPNQIEAIMAHRDKDKLDFQNQLAAASESAKQWLRDRGSKATA